MIDLRALGRDEEGVSSVLGVVLMVAVTIVLAAIIGTYVLGIGGDLTDSSPSASFEISSSENNGNATVAIIHGGGDNVDAESLEVTIGEHTVYTDGSKQTPSDITVDNGWDGRQVTTSDRLNIQGNNSAIEAGDLILVVWSGEDSSSILAEETVG